MTTLSTTTNASPDPGKAAAKPKAERSLRSKTIRGTAITVAGFGTAQLVRMITGVVLAKLLTPDAFGLMLLVNVVVSALVMFTDLGSGAAIVQNKRGKEPAFLNTAWTIQILRGLVIAALTCAIAWPYAWFYEQPVLVFMLILAATQPFIRGFDTTARRVYQRELKVGALTMLDLGVQILNAAITIGLAWWLRSVWALVIALPISALMMVVSGHICLKGIPHRLKWDHPAAKEIFRFGIWLLAATMLGFGASHVDKLVMGKLVSPATLGLFWIASSLAMMPTQAVQKIMSVVVFPMLSESARNNREAFPAKAALARRTLNALGALPVLGIVIGGPLLLVLVYPAAYFGAIWMLPGLVIARWFSCVSASSNAILLALGDSRASFIQNMVKLTSTVALMIGLGMVYGIIGIITGMVIGQYMGLLTTSLLLRRQGVNVFGQDTGAAACALAVIAFSGLILGWGGDDLSLLTLQPAALALSVALLAAAGGWAWLAVRRVRAVGHQPAKPKPEAGDAKP